MFKHVKFNTIKISRKNILSFLLMFLFFVFLDNSFAFAFVRVYPQLITFDLDKKQTTFAVTLENAGSTNETYKLYIGFSYINDEGKVVEIKEISKVDKYDLSLKKSLLSLHHPQDTFF
ncbi:hypothetical protein DEFDS_P052 (plasmid) [Deferribacter desulfuricans SSM1]|uniref:Uncharacterized protein n=1 Tax=Deferribacter desulfuricans (strain DSM 14783 / JCM 11476 / NBRC 101012 / SSM1) TaxID=639282 RepID=D3PEN4_DEFDS|nr:hypothetical protein [Deferribacter desulfuricans]BAI81676.1 hypothetical protein DEFDS_P052 [Deferribacter desulfuricans SSM1]